MLERISNGEIINKSSPQANIYNWNQLVAQYVQWHLFPISPELQEPLWTSSSVELRSSLLLCKQNTRKYEKKKGRGFPFVV
ncbi:hypothetical protein HID58_047946 [Brassica napus]|uniref:Uncharacterized protein n=1 Tax=Brassica napus TaxID=3708 RepID=A0ABQ8B124_BRANA|nr:hypothetical protein HID58_047946 [Brassica napus]